MAIKKELFIGSSKLVEFDGKTSIPTCIHFGKNKIINGYPALIAANSPDEINDNFKIQIGNISPGRLDPPRFFCADGKMRSANEIAKEFILNVISRADDWVSLNGYKSADRILVAEPLSMDKEIPELDNWLPNYRQRLKAILCSRFKNIDFLPEPFAVFQYYRYGIKHPLVSSATKHVALVLDFGGGTFDVSVVETTAAGDVSASGRNSKPLSASSTTVGGYFINKEVSRLLITENSLKTIDKTNMQKAWKTFNEYGTGNEKDLLSLRDDFQNFITNIKILISEVENAKINICNLIDNWKIDAEFENCPAIQIQVPANPFSKNPELIKVRFDAYQLRKIFIERIWKGNIRDSIIQAISRAESDLSGRPITVILLSGGSSNIRWLGELISIELNNLLPQAEILELQENFQEIVSKGLAIECARRTYNEGVGDFQLVTYNRLCLVLGADEEHPRGFSYRIQNSELNGVRLEEGVLLPSASMLATHIGKPLRWKVKLPSPPKQKLEYYFLKSTLDYGDIKSVHNVDCKVFTPPGTKFDSHIQIELIVKEDGTATPKFTYKQGWEKILPTEVSGKPFHMDMTVGSSSSIGEAYLGFDFGSSNSSISYIEQNAIRLFTQRSGEKNWLDLNELVSVLPYPVSNPLANFLAASTHDELAKNFCNAIESNLMFIGYLSFSEHCAEKNQKETKLFKSFTKASAGPLWDLCKKCIIEVGKHGNLTKNFVKLTEENNTRLIDEAISFINDTKHHRKPNEIDYHKVLNLLGNTIMQALKNRNFGIFEGISKKPFSNEYTGIFRPIIGSHGPFVSFYKYSGADSFSEQEVFIIDTDTGVAISLAPTMYWITRSNNCEANLALLDSINNNSANYRSTTGGGSIEINEGSNLSALFNMCKELQINDQKKNKYTNLSWENHAIHSPK